MLKSIASVFCFFFTLGSVFSQSDIHRYVYRLTITRNDNKTVVQSGFKLKGYKGIYTALHGVHRYKSISAKFNNKDEEIFNLRVVKVDVENDIAILNDENIINNIPMNQGLNSSRQEPVFNQFVRTLSFPMGMAKVYDRSSTTNGGVTLKEKEVLEYRIAGNSIKILGQRTSPKLGNEVYIITGPLNKGESGGAILNSADEVIALIDGGIGGINWAIPLYKIRSEVISSERQITALKNIPDVQPEELFSSIYIEENVVEKNVPAYTDGAFINVSWCVVHEGVRLFDINEKIITGIEGQLRPISELRREFLQHQQHNSEAQKFINDSNDTELVEIVKRISLDYEKELFINLNWVANNQRHKGYLLEKLSVGDFKELRRFFGQAQGHNPNVKNLMAMVSNDKLRELINKL
jgi:hypothetical protein